VARDAGVEKRLVHVPRMGRIVAHVDHGGPSVVGVPAVHVVDFQADGFSGDQIRQSARRLPVSPLVVLGSLDVRRRIPSVGEQSNVSPSMIG